MGVCGFMGKLVTFGFNAAFSTVLVPKQCFLNNRNLSILQKFGFAVIAGGVLFLLVQAPSAYLLVVIPTSYPRLDVSETTWYSTVVTAEMAGTAATDHCNKAENNRYAYIGSPEHGKWSDFTCVDPQHLGDQGDPGHAVDELFIPTAILENTQVVAQETASSNACSVGMTCVAGASSDWDNRVAGTSKKVTTPETPMAMPYQCECQERPTSYLVAGVGAQMVSLDHVMQVTNTMGKHFVSQGSLSDDANKSNGEATPLLMIIMTYDGKKWVEGNCESGVNRQEPSVAGEDHCRFGDGNIADMSVDDWLKLGGIESLDGINTQSGLPDNTDTYYGDTPGNVNPTYRVSGLTLNLHMEYLDSAWHATRDWKDPASGTAKLFPGIVCFVKVMVNPQPALAKTVNVVSAGAADEYTGTVRRQVKAGVHFETRFSDNSKAGFVTLIALVQFLAVTVVWFNFATLGCMYLALYTLGTTSRNYARVIREQCNVAVQCARRTPAKMIQAACAYFVMREWEHDKAEMHKFMDDTTTIHKNTIKKFMMTCYNPDLLPEIEEDEVDDMVQACWDEMTGGGVREGVTLIEFIESDLSSEPVDYLSMKAAFNKQRKKTPFERIFGDSVQHYDDKDKKLCFGLIPNPAMMKDASDTKARTALRSTLSATLSLAGAFDVLDGKAAAKKMMGGGLSAMKGGFKVGGALAGVGGDLTKGVAGMGLGVGKNLVGGGLKSAGSVVGGMGGMFGMGGKKKEEEEKKE